MKHDTDVGRIMFKSLPEYYHCEKRGAKANTIRSVTDDEYSAMMWCMPDTIMITNVKTGESFVREISSIIRVPSSIGVPAKSGECLVLISWWS